MYAINEPIDRDVVAADRAARTSTYVPRVDARGRHELLQQHRRPLLRRQRRCCRASRRRRATTSAASSINTGVRLRRPDRHRVRGGHPARRRGLRPDVRRTGASRRVRTCSFRCWGPTTVRDGTGSILRLLWSPDQLRSRRAGAQRAVRPRLRRPARRRRSRRTTLVDQAALDPYTFIRRSYLQRREYLVYDGKPPPEKDDD